MFFARDSRGVLKMTHQIHIKVAYLLPYFTHIHTSLADVGDPRFRGSHGHRRNQGDFTLIALSISGGQELLTRPH